MHITESSLDAHLPVSAPAEDQPAEYTDRNGATIWQTLHGHAPISSLIWDLCVRRLIVAAPETDEFEISTDEDGNRILDVYTEVGFSPFTRSRDQRLEIRGWDLVDYICPDPELDIRINHGTDLEVRIKATLLRHFGQALLLRREPTATHETTSVGTATHESTGAQS